MQTQFNIKNTINIPEISPSPIRPPSFEENTLEPSSAKQQLVFFAQTEEDKLLKRLIDLKITDRTGRLYPEHIKDFVLPELEANQIESIDTLIASKINIKGRRPYVPLNVSLEAKQILKKSKENLERPEGDCVKFCGSRLRYILGIPYFSHVFHRFFKETLHCADIDINDFITPLLKKRLKKVGTDADFHIFLFQETIEKCMCAADSITKTLEINIDTANLSKILISNYLKGLKKRVTRLKKNDYLIKTLAFDEYLEPNHPKLIRTFLKVDAFIQFADIIEKGLFIRSIGDRVANNFDFVYFSSKNSREGVFSIDSLGVFIDGLVDGKNKKDLHLLPFSSEGEEMQYFIDHAAGLYRKKKGKQEPRDFIRALAADLDGMKCLEETGDSLLQTLESTGKVGEDFALEIVRMLKHATKSIYTNITNPERLIGMTFRACQYLLLRGNKYEDDIQLIWQKIFNHLEDISKFTNAQIVHPFFLTLIDLLQTPFMTFKDIEDCFQIACYIGLNIPKTLGSAYQIAISQDENGPLMQLWIKSQQEATNTDDLMMILPFSYNPHQALKRILQKGKEETLLALKKVFTTLLKKPIHKGIRQESPLKPYSDHALLRSRDIEEQGRMMAASFNPILKELGYKVLFALSKQKNLPGLLPFFIKGFLYSKDTDLAADVKNELLLTLQGLYEGTDLAPIMSPHSSLMKLLSSENFMQSNSYNQLSNIILDIAKKNAVMKQLACDLYIELESSIPENLHSAFIFEFLKLLKDNIPLMVRACRQANKSEQLKPFLKLRVLIGTAHNCLKEKNFYPFIEILREETCNLIRKGMNPFENNEDSKHLQNLSKIINLMLEEILAHRYYKEANEMLSLCLENQLIAVCAEIAEYWRIIFNHLFENPDYGLIDAYDSWKLAQRLQLWEFLQSSAQQELLDKFANLISLNSNGANDSIQGLYNAIMTSSNEEVVYTFLLKQFHNRLQDSFTQNEINHLIFSFLQILQKNNQLIATPHCTEYSLENEKKIVFTLIKNIFEFYPISKSNLKILKDFFLLIFKRYSLQETQEILAFIFKYWKEALLQTQIESKTFLYTMVEAVFENFLYASFCKLFTNELYQQFFSLFEKTFQILQNEPLTLSLKSLFQNQKLDNLAKDLKDKNLYEELMNLFLILISCNPPNFFTFQYIELSFWTLESFFNKFDSSKIDKLEKLANFILPIALALKNAGIKTQAVKIHKEMIALEMQEKRFLKAYDEYKKGIELNILKERSIPNILSIKAAHCLILGQDILSATKILSKISNITPQENEEIKSEWLSILKTLSTKTTYFQSAKIILSNKLFDPYSAELVTYLESVIEALMLQHQKKIVKLCLPDNDFGVLSLTFNLLKRSNIMKGSLWIETLSAIKNADEQPLMREAIDLLYNNLVRISPIDLGICWEIALKGIRKISYINLIDLLDKDHVMFSFYHIPELKHLKMSVYKSLCKRIITLFELNQAKSSLFSQKYFILLLKREIELKEFDPDTFLKRFKYVLNFRNKAAFLIDGLDYLTNVLKLEFKKLQEKPSIDFSKELREGFFHLHLELNNLLTYARRQISPRHDKVSELSEECKVKLGEQGIRLIQFIQNAKVTIGQETYEIPCDHVTFLNFLLEFGEKYKKELCFSLEKIICTNRPEHDPYKQHQGIKTIFAGLLLNFLQSPVRELNRSAANCLEHPNILNWISVGSRQYLKKSISPLRYPITYLFRKDIHQYMLNEIKLNEGIGNHKELQQARISLRNKLRREMTPYVNLVEIIRLFSVALLFSVIYYYNRDANK